MWNKDELKGKAEKTKGKAKRALADVTGDERLRNEGEVDETAGRVRETIGKGRRQVGETVEKIGKKIKR